MLRAVLVALGLACAAGSSEAASTWYVKGDAAAGGDGSRNRPFATLEQVETASQPGDTIRVLPSMRPLDGGIQLKENQRLIGLGDPVTKTTASSVARPTITNTSSARHDGDAIRLATNTLVQNIHIDGASRSGIWPEGFVIYQSQGNHFGGITLLACGPGASSYCASHAPAVRPATDTGQTVIANNVIRDSNLEGIMVLTDTGVTAGYTITDTVVKDLSQNLPRPESLKPQVGIVRSRAFTLIALNGSQVTLTMDRFHAENVAPPGNYAADGYVFLTGGNAPVVNAKVSRLTMLNPKMTGEVNNGDSIEIQHRGTSNGVLNIEMSRLDLRDPASANIKVLEAANPSNGTYNLSISDSVFTNTNPAGTLDGQIRLSGASNGLKAFTLAVRNTRFSGLGGAIGILNTNNVERLTVLVENSSLSNLTQSAGASPIAAVTMTHPADKTLGTAIVDLGGGSLGSRGRNRFVNNAGLDVSISNANTATSPIKVDASGNFWGGGAPATAPATPADVSMTGNVTFNPPTHLTSDPGT
jgi:hypothetical protein